MHLPAVHSASWESNPLRFSERRPPLLRRLTTLLSLQRSALGLDASIFNASACHGLRCGCAAPSEYIPCGLPVSRQQKESKKCAVLFYFQGTQSGKIKPPHFPCRKIKGATTEIFLLSKIFFDLARILPIRLLIACCDIPYSEASSVSNNVGKLKASHLPAAKG